MAPQGGVSNTCLAQPLGLSSALCRDWEGRCGRTYRISPEGEGWSCSLQNPSPGEQSHTFTITYDKTDGLAWWGGGGTFFLDPAELSSRPHEVKWYLVGDLRRLARADWKPRIMWSAMDKEPEPALQPAPFAPVCAAPTPPALPAFRPPPGLEGLCPLAPPGTFTKGQPPSSPECNMMKPKLSSADTEAASNCHSEVTCSDDSEVEQMPPTAGGAEDAGAKTVAPGTRPPPGFFNAPEALPSFPAGANAMLWKMSAGGNKATPPSTTGTVAPGSDAGARTKLSSKARLYVPQAESTPSLPMQPTTAAVMDHQPVPVLKEPTSRCLVLREGLLQVLDMPSQPMMPCPPPIGSPRGLPTLGAAKGRRQGTSRKN